MSQDGGSLRAMWRVTPSPNRVDAWSHERLKFDNLPPWMKDFKSAVQGAVRGLRPAPGQVLCGLYSSLETRTCDVENVLFYNVGPGSFRTATPHGLSFARAHHALIPESSGRPSRSEFWEPRTLSCPRAHPVGARIQSR